MDTVCLRSYPIVRNQRNVQPSLLVTFITNPYPLTMQVQENEPLFAVRHIKVDLTVSTQNLPMHG